MINAAVMSAVALAALLPNAASANASAVPAFVDAGAASNGVVVDARGHATVGGGAGGVVVELLRAEKDVKRRVARFAAVKLAGGDTLLLADSEVEQTENGETAWLLDDMMAARVDAAGKKVWRQAITNHSGDPTRDVFVLEKVIVLRERDGVEGVDVATGKKLWFVDRDAIESVLNNPMYWHAALDAKGETLLVSGRFPHPTAAGRSAFEIELDVATGARVFRSTKYAAPKPAPIYVRPEFRLEYPGDKAPPEVPVDWDGLRVHRTFLAWNKKTGEGIVVDPLQSDARAIIAAAKAAKVKGAPVKWLYVVDLGALAAASDQALDEATAKKSTGAKDGPLGAIALVDAGSIAGAGERVDAKTVAQALGARALDAAAVVAAEPPPPAQAGALTFFHPGDDDRRIIGDKKSWLCLQWGPYFFAGEHEVLYRLQEQPD